VKALHSEATESSEGVRTFALYATVVLFLTNVTNYLDRSSLSLVVQPVKAALRLSDAEIGLMQGGAFVVTFVTAGLFLGRLVDKSNRRILLVVCIAIWSLSAAACGTVRSGWELFVCRMGVGLGESALIPCAVSLIADYFPTHYRGRAYGFFMTGAYVGTGLSLILVGLALPPLSALSAQVLAQYHVVIEPWRMVMFSMLIPGVLCGSLLLSVREPSRVHDGTNMVSGPQGSREWLANWRILLPHHLCSALIAMSMYGINSWMPTVLIREHAFPAKDAGLLYGCTVSVVGMISAILAGRFADRASRNKGAAGRLRFGLATAGVGAIGFLIIGLAGDTTWLLIGSVCVISSMGMSQVATVLLISDLVSGYSRGRITSIYFAFAGVIGTAGGPFFVGYLNDQLAGRLGSLSTSISCVGITAAVLGIGFGLLTLFRLERGASHQSDRFATV